MNAKEPKGTGVEQIHSRHNVSKVIAKRNLPMQDANPMYEVQRFIACSKQRYAWEVKRFVGRER